MIRDKQVIAFIRRLQVTAPVNIVSIAKVFGLQVWEDSTLPEGIAGKLFKDDTNGGASGYSIVARAQDPHVRKRFTIAHELAHYLLHRHLFATAIVDDALYRSTLSTRIESEANALAADLLMPWHLLVGNINRPLPELALMFEVSEQAMQIRLESAERGMRSLAVPQSA